jgi:hypothetical protein
LRPAGVGFFVGFLAVALLRLRILLIAATGIITNLTP